MSKEHYCEGKLRRIFGGLVNPEEIKEGISLEKIADELQKSRL